MDDGTPLTRADILFTLKASCCPLTNNPHARSYWENLLSIETDTKDSLAITLVMKQAYIQNTGILAEVPALQRSFLMRKMFFHVIPWKISGSLHLSPPTIPIS
jgi:hypothetical protein